MLNWNRTWTWEVLTPDKVNIWTSSTITSAITHKFIAPKSWPVTLHVFWTTINCYRIAFEDISDLNVKREVCVPLPYQNCPYTEEDRGLQSPTVSLHCAGSWRILASLRVLQRGPCNSMTEDLSVYSYLLYLEVPQCLDNLWDKPIDCTHCVIIR
jgi:hypothetical protein